MSKTKKASKAKAPATPKPASGAGEPKSRKCRAAEVGHKSCQCGGPDCGANIHDPYAV